MTHPLLRGEKMLFSVVIPTLGTRAQEFERLLRSLHEQTYKNLEVIVVSQDNHMVVEEYLHRFPELNIHHIKATKKGLSLARNMAIPFIKGEIVTFSDDDCWYPKDALLNVKNAFDKKDSSDIVCFQIYDPSQDEYYKNYPMNDIDKLNMRQIFQKSSIEIFLKMKSLNKENLLFNEKFGLGAKYPSGEENILLSNLYRTGLKISYQNKVVVYHLKPSIESRLNFSAFMSKGPLFKEIFGPFKGFIMLTALFLKKISVIERPIYFYLSALKEMYLYKRNG